MAFPTIQGADTKNGTQASNSTSWTLTYPTNIASGDLLLAFIGSDGGGAYDGTALSFPAGWVVVAANRDSSSNNVSFAIAAKIAAGTETGTFTVTMRATEQGGWRVFRITGWYGSGLPSAGTTSLNDGSVCCRYQPYHLSLSTCQ
jgi:hypothetical protein